jgi:hypothetical protein
MAFTPFANGSTTLQPFDQKAGRIKPHEWSRQVELMLEDWRCPTCGTTLDHASLSPHTFAEVYCVAGHRSNLQDALDRTIARVHAASKKMGRKS